MGLAQMIFLITDSCSKPLERGAILITHTHMNNDTILYFDIETAACVPVSQYAALSEIQRRRWISHADARRHDDEAWVESGMADTLDKAAFEQTAALYPEYGRVVCIAWALGDEDVRSVLFLNEVGLLEMFSARLQELPRETKLCGHNIKGFDVPFLRKRYLLNGLPVPRLLRVGTLKPWEQPYIDTAELWAGGGKRDFSSLELLCDLLDITQPKTDLTGADVSEMFWQVVEERLPPHALSVEGEARLERIETYCKADVVAVRELHRRLANA